MDMLHIKIDEGFNKELKKLAKLRNLTVSELIRQALVMCYQFEFSGLTTRQKQALEAYRGGYISLGKLSELMGLSILEMQEWLSEHQIPQNNSFLEDDVASAAS